MDGSFSDDTQTGGFNRMLTRAVIINGVASADENNNATDNENNNEVTNSETNDDLNQNISESTEDNNNNEETNDMETDDYCLICYEGYSSLLDHHLASIQCGHFFGYSCLMQWIRCSGDRAMCPVCCISFTIEHIRKHCGTSVPKTNEERGSTRSTNSIASEFRFSREYSGRLDENRRVARDARSARGTISESRIVEYPPPPPPSPAPTRTSPSPTSIVVPVPVRVQLQAPVPSCVLSLASIPPPLVVHPVFDAHPLQHTPHQNIYVGPLVPHEYFHCLPSHLQNSIFYWDSVNYFR